MSPPPPPPSLDVLERTVAAGVAYEFPGRLGGFLDLVLGAAPAIFIRSDYGRICAAALALSKSKVPVSPLTLAPLTKESATLGSLASEVCPPAIVEHAAGILWRYHLAKDFTRRLRGILEHIESRSDDLDDLPSRFRAFADELENALLPY